MSPLSQYDYKILICMNDLSFLKSLESSLSQVFNDEVMTIMAYETYEALEQYKKQSFDFVISSYDFEEKEMTGVVLYTLLDDVIGISPSTSFILLGQKDTTLFLNHLEQDNFHYIEKEERQFESLLKKMHEICPEIVHCENNAGRLAGPNSPPMMKN